MIKKKKKGQNSNSDKVLKKKKNQTDMFCFVFCLEILFNILRYFYTTCLLGWRRQTDIIIIVNLWKDYYYFFGKKIKIVIKLTGQETSWKIMRLCASTKRKDLQRSYDIRSSESHILFLFSLFPFSFSHALFIKQKHQLLISHIVFSLLKGNPERELWDYSPFEAKR